jgi:choloylglycine hydrolase
MEFGVPVDSRMVIRARGTHLTSPAPGGAKGLSWTGKYGYVYLDAFGIDAPVDGLNEAGLGIGDLYFPTFAGYENVTPAMNAQALSNLQVGAWVLSQFANTDEVKAALPSVHVWGEPVASFENTPLPAHYIVHDARGKSIVLEWTNGKLTVFDNTIGVMTNSPPFDWQTINLRNYVSISPNNVSPVTVAGVTYAATGQGSGLFGMPGDPTPPSRFVATAIALNAAFQPKDAVGALILAQKLMNRMDLPAGLARDGPGSPHSDTTQWAVFRDHTNKVYYYRTYSDMSLRAIDLKKIDFSAGTAPRRLAIGDPKPEVQTVDTTSFKAF